MFCWFFFFFFCSSFQYCFCEIVTNVTKAIEKTLAFNNRPDDYFRKESHFNDVREKKKIIEKKEKQQLSTWFRRESSRFRILTRQHRINFNSTVRAPANKDK